MLQPQPLHRALRTRADTTGALLRALLAAGIVVAVLLLLGWPVGGGGDDAPPLPAGPAPAEGTLPAEGRSLVLPAERDPRR